jgi:hypothetical protein
MVKVDILTYATNYDYDIFERFVGTLNDTGFNGKIYIIINNNDIATIDLLNKKYNNVVSLLDDLEIAPHLPPHTRRFLIKQKYVNMISFECDYLLLCDFRDVLFQKNIENYNYDDGNVDLYGFLEGKTICENSFNIFWLKCLEEIFNENFYDKISHNPIICSGTTIGKVGAIKQYIHTMCDYIVKYNIITILDQGIHNYMFYLNKFNGLCVKLSSNEDNFVNTVGLDVQLLDKENNIVNKHNSVSFIVHQYDRFPMELKQQLSDKHGYNFLK